MSSAGLLALAGSLPRADRLVIEDLLCGTCRQRVARLAGAGELPLASEVGELGGVARATICGALAGLRRDQGLIKEAQALSGPAARLHENPGDPQAAGEMLAELGWFCLDEGDPKTALPVLERAVALLDPHARPAATQRAKKGLAWCRDLLAPHPAVPGPRSSTAPGDRSVG